MALFRHGDILIASTEAIPAEAHLLPTTVLAYGEVTGHSHRVEDAQSAEIWEWSGLHFLKVSTATRVIHDEHHPIDLPSGIYRFWRQREYTPEAIRPIYD
jgi:hypothetical protein